MDNIWIILLALSAILIAFYSKKVDKAEYPSNYEKKGKKGKKAKKAKKAKAAKPVRENRMLEGSMLGLFIGIVLSTILVDKIALCISGCFFAGLVLGMIFKRKIYVECLEEPEIEELLVDIPEAAEEIPSEETVAEEVAAEPEAEIITAE